ncbi:MAG: nuclear transport factor 2 family protein [Deltaproteobacteria bacterium]|nr:nuclear transport factor 2 family protein [Deltaproteobacteria bacterium]
MTTTSVPKPPGRAVLRLAGVFTQLTCAACLLLGTIAFVLIQQSKLGDTPLAIVWGIVALTGLVLGGLMSRGGLIEVIGSGLVDAAFGLTLLVVDYDDLRSLLRILPEDDVEVIADALVAAGGAMLAISAVCFAAIPQALRYTRWLNSPTADDASSSAAPEQLASSTARGFPPPPVSAIKGSVWHMPAQPGEGPSRRRLYFALAGFAIGFGAGIGVLVSSSKSSGSSSSTSADSSEDGGDGKSGDGKSGDGKTADGKSADGKSGDGKSGDGKSGDGKSGDGKSGDGKSGDGKSGDSKSGDGKTADGKSGDGKTADGKSGDGKSGDGKSGDGKSGDGKAGDGKAGDGKSGDGKSGDGKAGDGKPAGAKEVATPTLEALLAAERDAIAKGDAQALVALAADNAFAFGVDADEVAEGRAAIAALVARDLELASGGGSVTSRFKHVGQLRDAAWIAEELDVMPRGRPTRRLAVTTLAAFVGTRWVVVAWCWAKQVPDADAERVAILGTKPRPKTIPNAVDGPKDFETAVRAAFASWRGFVDARSVRADGFNFGSAPNERSAGSGIKPMFSRMGATLSLREDALRAAAGTAWDSGQKDPYVGFAAANVDLTLKARAGTDLTQSFRVLAVVVKEGTSWKVVQTQWSHGGPIR